MTKPKLKWIACNGIMPDLPDKIYIRVIEDYGDGDIRRLAYWKPTPINWRDIICYALEPLDPVQYLIDAAKRVAEFMPEMSHTDARSCAQQRVDADELRCAIKAVEEMKDE